MFKHVLETPNPDSACTEAFHDWCNMCLLATQL